MADRLIFLSHAGVDSAAALALAERIERAGVKVWIDKRDLLAGRGWQQQLEGVIDRESTAFAVYVGSRGVVNWVDSEVRVGLSRATRDAGYPFIPILAKGVDSGVLPAFARQFQGVRDVEGDPEALQRLLRAARGETGRAKIALESQPFLGLSAFDEAHTHLFFGRERETAELVERLRATNLLMVVGDSGSGKSSLVKAGLIPRVRGGAFATAQRDRPDDTPWHVVQMRPQTVPFERLVEAVGVAARTVGIDVETRLALGKAIRTRVPGTIRDALREGAPPKAHTLLVVDQFEELWTQAPESDRGSFIDALLGLTAAGDFVYRVVVTMRRDYYNLCSQHPAFFERVNARDAPERYQVRRMSDAALRDCIVKPLALTDAERVPVFADAVLADVGDQPAELALLEMALTEAWRRRGESGGNLLEAYERAGRVSGALANAAEWVFTEQLSDHERALAEPLFIRLVRLGDTGGTTRRIVARDELRDDAWALAQRLAGESYKRLLLVTADTVELAHEALVTQWPRYQNWLQPAAADKRRLDALMDDAARWAAADEADRHKFVARGFDLDNYVQVARNETRAAWLSDTEAAFVQASVEAAERHERQFADLYRKALGRQLASQAMRLLDEPRCRELETAVLLAVEAHRRHPSLEAQQALFRGVERLPLLLARIAVPPSGERSVVASPAGRYAAVGDGGSGFTIYDMEQGRPVCHPAFDEGTTLGRVFSDDERYFAAASSRHVRLWATESGALLGEFDAGSDRPGRLSFSPAGDLLAVMKPYGHRVRILRVDTLDLAADLAMGISKVPDMAFSPDGALFAALDETTATVWKTSGWERTHEFRTSGRERLFFSQDAAFLITLGRGAIQGWTMLDGELSFDVNWSSALSHGRSGPGSGGIAVATRQGLLRICSTRPFAERQRLEGHGGLFELCFDPAERRVAAFEFPGVVRVWDVEAGTEVERYLVNGTIRSLYLHFDDRGLGFTTGEETADGLTVSRYLGVPGLRRYRIESPETLLGHVVTSGDGARLAYAAEGLRVLSTESGRLQRHLPGAFGGMAFDPRGEFLCAARDDLFDSGVTLVSLRDEGGHRDLSCEGTTSYSRVRWSPDGRYVGVNGVPHTVTIWRRGLDRRFEIALREFPREFEFLPGERLMATLDDGPSVRIWELEERREIAALTIDGSHAGHLSCHPREPLVVASGANARRATIWDYASDRVVGSCEHPGNVEAHAISPCGRWLATIGMDDHAALLWRMPDGTPAHRLPHFDRVNACAFSTEGSWLATAGADRTVRVWNTTTGAQVAQINRHEPVQWAGFLPGDAWLVVRHGRTAEVLAWRPADLIEIAGERLRRNLSQTEWQTYMEDELYCLTFLDFEKP